MGLLKLFPGPLRPFLFFTAFFTFANAAATETSDVAPDSLAALHDLSELVVTATRPAADIIPAQTLTGEELHRINSNSVADALRYFSGVQVKDYGGVGGIKTVNIRSMGSNHSGVVYDGVELGNAQNGQIDLGQFSLDNLEAISLYNGQKSEILQPARDFGTAGSVYLRTRTPRFSSGKNYNLRANLRTGSFSLLNPSALLELQISPRVNCSLNAEWLNSSGKYKFRYRRVTPSGETAYDTIATRQNGDIDAVRLEANIIGTFPAGNWHFKAYHYNSERGIPGAIVNNVWRRGERIWDRNSFAQASCSAFLGNFSTLNNIKYAFYRTHYVNNDDRQLKVDNLYRQREFYFSTSNEYRLLPPWRVSLGYDLLYNALSTDISDFKRPRRFSHFIALASSLSLDRFKAQASCLATLVNDRREGDESSSNRHVFTPAVILSGFPLRNNPDFSLRAFFKQSFRMPTFNDLYYADMGNASLDPERVTQYNFGILYDHSNPSGIFAQGRLSVDAYYNRVKDKIVAYPKGQQFRWTMLNLGLVEIRGLDLSGLISVRPTPTLLLTLRGQYTFQRAIDITSPADTYYRNQIPYVPRHSGSAIVNAAWRSWTLNYSFIYVGERYNQQENILFNYMQPWYTSDISISKDFAVGALSLRVLLEINNLFSQDYDVILNYPMPKRNFRLTLSVEL